MAKKIAERDVQEVALQVSECRLATELFRDIGAILRKATGFT